MKESKAIYVTKRDINYELNKDYQVYDTKVKRDTEFTPEPLRYDQKTQEVGCQYDNKRDNLICTCRHLATIRKRQEKQDTRYFGLPKQIYTYHGTRSFTDIGVGSVKALQRKKVKRIYLPETDDRGVGSSDLSTYLNRRSRQRRAGSYYDHKRTSSKCVGGILEYNTGCVMNEKLSPIIHTVSGSTSPRDSTYIKNIEIGSNTVVKSLMNTTTQVEDIAKKEIEIKSEAKVEEIKPVLVVKEDIKEMKGKTVDTNGNTSQIDQKDKDTEKEYSSDSLVQHVHNLENPSDAYKRSRMSMNPVDPMENKLEREYRRIFAAKSKDTKSSTEKTMSDFKSTSTLKRRFEALRRGLVKKEDSKKSAVIAPDPSSPISAPSRKDVSINSDPPSLEGRSYSNTKTFSPFPKSYSRDKTEYPRTSHYRRSVTGKKERGSAQWSSRPGDEDSESQGVKGMFKLWGKKFNLEEDYYGKKNATPKPSYISSYQPSKKPERKIEEPKLVIKDDAEGKKDGKRFFFFKKKNKYKDKPYKSKKGVTTGRCEVRDGLMIKIGGGANSYVPEQIVKEPEVRPDEYEDIVRRAWLTKFLSHAIESRNSVKVRWNNKTYPTSSSTIFELMDTVYKDTGVVFRSKSLVTVHSSYKSYTKQHVNFVHQNIEAWMIPKTMTDSPKLLPKLRCRSNEERKDNIEVRISDQKWFIDKSKAFSHKIEVVLHSNNMVKLDKEDSSEYLRIEIPKGFFIDSSSDDNNKHTVNQSSDEEVFKIVEYETGSDLKKDKPIRNFDIGDHKTNNIKVTVSVKDSNDCDQKVLETMIKRPPEHRSVSIQGSHVYIPKRCDLIGVGIITQRDLRVIRKPILKIQDDYSDEEESEHNVLRANKTKCELAESYLQDYYRHCTPLGIDLYSWCVSDSHLKCCSENSRVSFNNQGDVTKSCPNIYDDFQASTIIPPCGAASCSHCHVHEPNAPVEKSGWFGKFKKKNKDAQHPNADKRILPKDSIEVCKRRKIYACSNKSKWADCVEPKPSADARCQPLSMPSKESKGAQNTQVECPKLMRSCCKPIETKPKKRPCKKHVSLPDCETMNDLLAKQLTDSLPEGILAFKTGGCDACKKKVLCPKHATIVPTPSCEIPQAPCKASCESMSNPPCSQSKSSCEKPPSPPCKMSCPASACKNLPPGPPSPCPPPPCPPSPCPPSPPPCEKPPSCPPTPPPCPPTSPCKKKPPCPPSPPPCKKPSSCPSNSSRSKKKQSSCPPSPPPCKKPPPCPPSPPPCCRPPPCPSPPPSPPPCCRPPPSPPPCCKPPPNPPPCCKPPPSPPPCCKPPPCPSPPPSPPPCRKPSPSPCKSKPSPPPCKKPPSCPPPPCPPSPPPCKKPCTPTPSCKRQVTCPPSPPPCRKPRCPHSPPSCPHIPPCPPSPRPCPPSPRSCPHTPPCPPSPPPCPHTPPCPPSPPPCPHTPPCPPSPPPCPHTPPCPPSPPPCPHTPPCPPSPPPCPHTPPCPPSPPPCPRPPPSRPKPCPHTPPCTPPPKCCRSKPCPMAPPSCPSSQPICCGPDPNRCPGLPPPCKKGSLNICKKFSPFFRKKTSCPASPPCKPMPCNESFCRKMACQESPSELPPCKKPKPSPRDLPPCKKPKPSPCDLPPCKKPKPSPCDLPPCKKPKPSPCQKFSTTSCSYGSLDAPFNYSPIHPCPQEAERPRMKVLPCSSSPCSNHHHYRNKPKYESRKPPTPAPALPHSHCDECRTSTEDFPWPTKTQVSNQSSSTSLYQCERQEDNKYGQCKKSCPLMPKLSCDTIPSPKKECKQSCPNRQKEPRPPCVPATQCPPPKPCPSPPKTPSPTEMRQCRSKSKVSGLYLKMKPVVKKKTCSKDCSAWGSGEMDEGCISLNSQEKITIRLKKDKCSTDEIREGLNIKVQDEDGMTLFERKDYRLQHADCSDHRSSLLGDMYKASEVRRVTTNKSLEDIGSDKDRDKKTADGQSEASIANLIEIQFKLKVTQGEKSTEINVANDEEKDVEGEDKIEILDPINKMPQEIFLVNDGTERPIENADPKNDINIRIVIKNFKPKAGKKKSVNLKTDDYCKDFSKKISAKFHTVSTGYSDVLHDDNVFSIHRATVDLTSSVDKSKTQSNKSEEIMSEALTDTRRDNYIKSDVSVCRCATTDMSDSRFDYDEVKSIPSTKYSEHRDTQEYPEETDTEKQTENKYDTDEIDTDKQTDHKYDTEETDTDKPPEPKYDTEETDTEKLSQPKYDTFMSTDTDDQEAIPEENTYSDKPKSIEVIVKPHTKDEKKEMLKRVFEKAHETKTKNKTRMRKLRDMLKVILTSDSSDHEETKLQAKELANDVTYASLKPNYFRDSDSMNNYYRTESNIQLSDGEIKRQVVYPSIENNSECSNSNPSDALSSGGSYHQESQLPNTGGGCMCSTFAQRLKLATRMGEVGGCCCSAKSAHPRKNEETTSTCDLKKDSDLFQYEYRPNEYVDVETQNSRYLTSKINSTNLSLHTSMRSSIADGVNVSKLDSGIINVDDRNFNPLRNTYSPPMNVRNCEMRNMPRNTILTISDEDKIMLLSSKPNRFSAECTKCKVKEKKRCREPVSLLRASDILQSYETKKAVLEIYTEKTISDDGEHLVAKLPKFVYDRENEIHTNYDAMAADTDTSCKKNIVMMAINR